MKKIISLILALLIMLGAIALIVLTFILRFSGEDFDLMALASYETAIFIPFLLFVSAVGIVLKNKNKDDD